MTLPSPDSTPVAHPRRQKPPRVPLLPLAVVILLGAAVAGYFLLSGPRIVFANRMAGPVRLAVDAEEPRLISPGGSVRVSLPRSRSLVAVWELVRPLSADGQSMGQEVRGTLVIPEPRGTIHRAATARGAHGDYFAPLITNASNALLRVTVNAGLEGAVDCGCAVRPDAKRVFIGYYRLYRNSTVRARTGDRREATFRDLGPSVTSSDGTVGLRFESKDLVRQGPAS